MKFLGNAFSLQMLTASEVALKIREVAPSDVVFDRSVIGHADTAAVVSDILKTPVACNRESIVLGKNDVLFVAQVTGGRLPEGTTTLPEGFKIKFMEVSIN